MRIENDSVKRYNELAKNLFGGDFYNFGNEVMNNNNNKSISYKRLSSDVFDEDENCTKKKQNKKITSNSKNYF